MPRNEDTPVIQDGDAEVTGQLQAGSVAVQDKILQQINNKLAVDGQVLVTEAQRNAINGYAGLDQNGKLIAAVLPEISISRVFVVASQAAQLALTADEGDLAIRSDLARSYVHNGGSTGTMADWLELARTSDHVYSVAGKVGAVELDTNDIGGLSTALSGKANTSHTHQLADITNAGTSTSRNVPASGNAASNEVVLGSDTRLSDTRDPKAHTHPISDVTNLQSTLDTLATANHTHTTGQITGLGSAALRNVSPTGTDAFGGEVVIGTDTRLTNNRDPNPHNHIISDVTNLQTTLDGKALASHTHGLASITDAGTAAAKTAAANGTDATSEQVVMGWDTRLTNSRTPIAHTHPASDITGLNDAVTSKQDLSEKNQPSGYAGLDSNGKIQNSALPALSITSISTAASQSAQLALGAQEGDVVIRTDESKTYIHNGGTAGTMADFTLVLTPPDVVQSVAGKTGSITLDTSDVTGLVSALAGKADLVHKSRHAVTAGANEVQLLTVAGNGGTGSFTLTFDGQTTSSIAVPATSVSIRKALEGLSNVGTGNVIVSTFIFPNLFRVEFVNGKGNADLALLSSDGSGITGSGTFYVQSGQPTGSDASDGWIDTSTNTLYRWTGTSWASFGSSPPYETASGAVKTLVMAFANGSADVGAADALYPSDINAAKAFHTHTSTHITDAGTVITRDVPASGNASSTQVVLGSDTRLTDSRTPGAHTHPISDITSLQTSLDGKAASSHTHTLSGITDAGTAAAKDVATSGDASSTQVVLGSDTRLTNSRTPTAHTHTASEITNAGTAATKNVAASGNASNTEVVLGSDTRLTDSRTPTAHKTSHATGGTDAIAPSDIGAVATTAFQRKTTTANVTVAAGAEVSVDLSLATAFTLWKVTSNKAARIRLYSTASDRTTDTSRAEGAVPSAGVGLITEIITTDTLLSLAMSPPQQGASLETTPSSTIKALVKNKSASADLELTFIFTPAEV